jgi:hypothetical protein
MKLASLYILAAFVSLFLSISGPVRAECLPVVYAFRHAEDVNTPPTLTAIGMKHADLYIEMVPQFGAPQDFCPVKFIYAVNPIKPGGVVGTTNPYKTAEPLARDLTKQEPIIKIGGKNIDEFLEAPNIGVNKFRGEMLSKVQAGSSVALFWTSQGLHNLGEAIAPGSNIPVNPKPPRNAAYVFPYDGREFIKLPKPDQYIQCFNWNVFRKQGDMSWSKYWCGHTISDLTVDKAYFDKLHGRICSTDDLLPDPKAPPDGYYGYCVSGP